MAKQRFSDNINIKNRQAAFRFELLDKYIAGMVLKGTEIKSIKEGKVSLQEGHCYFNKGELFIKGMSINPYAQGTHYNHEAARERKLLLKRSELKKLEAKSEEKGLTIVPLRIFINERGFAKLEIALARGKKLHDKREGIKERDLKRELGRVKFK
ncbi:MAG TPA: SsrA-binding protein SmpB [Cyclobacteriaceae bacterium]|nr:SsrA-binding protein SmpB [Cyclobacteriaceae bacterium]MCB9238707.1 SsrA-binding protein SmpB [Flammeovirgaceae bacterium]MCB0497983.1 SsrA-binding protein SmpB [Cyclobacteriaceae bacterium]MCO5270425.1 SsrA-binding protein SmpB [Cyclobacteriaceae bacterium]MCW5901133.1 SsrA-binding protein SmpB [Cyclobacteriaceae bacterium]